MNVVSCRAPQRGVFKGGLGYLNTEAQFFGPTAVNGDFGTDLFGKAVKAAPPRLVQVALKFISEILALRSAINSVLLKHINNFFHRV
jgi:hypothetical protein